MKKAPPILEFEPIFETEMDRVSGLPARKTKTDVMRSRDQRRYRIAVLISLVILVAVFIGGIIFS